MQINLIIKKEWFNAIRDGTKKEETRFASDRMLKQVCEFDKNGKPAAFKPIKTLLLLNGYRTDRAKMIVEVKKIEFAGEQENATFFVENVVFLLGKILFVSP